MDNKKEIFFCYAHEDEAFRIKLVKQLDFLQRQGFIDIWHDRNISPGTEWKQEIDTHLNAAHFILLLISPDFMYSDYCYGKEMKRAMERHEANEALVIPIILRPVHWHEAPFGKLQALPKDGKPILSPHWHNQDEAFFDVAEGIRQIITNKVVAKRYDVCLSYAASEAVWVGNLAQRLENEQHCHLLLKKGGIFREPGWSHKHIENKGQVRCHIVFLGAETPLEWFRREVQNIFALMEKEPSLRILPVLLPDADEMHLLHLPALGVWIDFRHNQDYAFHALICGIKGISPGRWAPSPRRIENRGYQGMPDTSS